MLVRTHIRHLDIEPDFEGIVRQAVAQRFGKLGNERDLVMDLFISAVAGPSELGGPMFEIHMSLWSPSLHRKIFAKETGEDFWSTISECEGAVKTQLQKMVEQRRDLNRRSRARHFDLAL